MREWKAFYECYLDTAIKRFNQAWMFDRKNLEVYWGLGLVTGQSATHSANFVNSVSMSFKSWKRVHEKSQA